MTSTPAGIDVRRHLLVQHPQEILRRHVLHAGIRAAVAPAMPACEVAPQRTLPEERIEAVFAHLVRIETGEEFEGQPFTRPIRRPGIVTVLPPWIQRIRRIPPEQPIRALRCARRAIRRSGTPTVLPRNGLHGMRRAARRT